MPRPASPLPPPDHARHDRALVAQHAAGDALDEGQQREAQRLVTSCAQCAELAADLRMLATVVRLETVPSRRRDFRLDPAQAERLRGNGLSRFLRRLSLPQSRAFAPAAAGALSVGLLFVVAGYAWPGEGGVSISPEPAGPPALELQLASPSLEQAMPLSTIDEGASAESELRLGEGPPDGSATSDAMEKGVDTSGEAPDDAALAGDDTALAREADSQAGVAEDLAVEDPAAQDTIAQDTIGEDAAAQGSRAAESSGAAELFSSMESAASAVPDEAEMASANDAAAAATTAASDERPPIAPWLTAIGVGLAIVGGLLSLLLWLTRRVADPLLR